MLGRPTTYNAEMLEKTKEYIRNYGEYGQVIPSVAGLAIALGVGRKTIQQWASREENADFARTLEELKATQELTLLNKGLTSEFNTTITKLALANHGYSEKQEVNDTSQDKTKYVIITDADRD